MRLPKPTVLLAVLLLVIAPMALPGTGLADDDNDNKKKNDKQETSTDRNKDNGPDLKIDFETGTSDQEPRFTITNKGTKDSPQTTATVVTLTPPPTNQKSFPIKALKPGESTTITYTLVGTCSGHAVKASVQLKDDPTPKDNTTETTICGARMPDLKIEKVGFVPADQDRSYYVRVTNIGAVASEQSRVHFETLGDKPANPGDSPFGPLDPGKSIEVSYTPLLPDGSFGCDGHVVKAVVVNPPSGDANPGNNVLDNLKLCDAKPQIIPSINADLPALNARYVDRPIYDRPGEPREVTFHAVRHRNLETAQKFDSACLNVDPTDDMDFAVGFWREPCVQHVFQTAVAFNLQQLRETRDRYGIVVHDAQLHIDYETQSRNTDPGSCVTAVGYPTADWTNAVGLIPNEPYVDGPRSDTWDAADLVQNWLNVPGLDALGIVLKGYDESLDNEDDDTVCYTNARNPRVTVRYTVVK